MGVESRSGKSREIKTKARRESGRPSAYLSGHCAIRQARRLLGDRHPIDQLDRLAFEQRAHALGNGFERLVCRDCRAEIVYVIGPSALRWLLNLELVVVVDHASVLP